MAGIGWQELVIVIILMFLWAVPVALMVRGTTRFYGTASTGWVIGSFFGGWVAFVLWLLVRRSPRPAAYPPRR